MELTQPKYRISSIDILRGIVMVIMALDHTRDYFHWPAMRYDPLDLTQTTPVIFFTRWITHFCAPTFVFLSGISAFLSSQKKSRSEASLFLIKRGLWLVLVEIVIVTFGITFKPYTIIVWQVIWAIGWSMVFLGILMRISYKVVLVAGLLLFFGHNIFDSVSLPSTGVIGTLCTVLFTASPSFFPIDETHFIADIYAILPWTGVMLLGFSIGYWFTKEFPAEKRKKLLLTTGFSLIALFIILRFTGIYGNPSPWQKQDSFIKNVLAFIDVNKYPPSLLYLSMTLGPSCILLALMENIKAKWTNVFTVYGQVPFFYYVLHFYLLHIILVAFFYANGYGSNDIADPGSFFNFRPVAFGYGLPVVYLIWLCAVAFLYLPCKWFSKYKKTHTQWWLSYL